MRLTKALQLTVALALLTGLTLSTSALGAGNKDGSAGKPKSSGKACGKKKSGKKKKCQAKGKTKGQQAPGSRGVPDCGSVKTECHIDVWVRQGSPTTGAVCSSFDSPSGFCVGSSTGTNSWAQPGYFPKQGIGTSFTWEGPGGPRTVDYTVDATFTIVDAYIRGNVPSGNSPVFNVTDAWNRGSGIHWKTESKPGAAPSQQGGPLWIDYNHEFVGSYVHLHGYLVPK
jgi:hypothetical protein